MRRVFLSFLGLGFPSGDSYDYRETTYLLHGQKSMTTRFVQVAEIQILGAANFDEIIIVATDQSKNLHFRRLTEELHSIGARRILCTTVQEDMSPRGQWSWFAAILDHIKDGDHLTVDVTHGYRAIPIIFSAAIHFLQRARSITLDSVFYGAYEKDKDLPPIIDMKGFFVVNEWAEAVSRLVEDADSRKLASLAKESPSFQAGELGNERLVALLDDLTHRIRDVDMHNVGRVARETLDVMEASSSEETPVGRVLLDLVREKYSTLVGTAPATGRYDLAYFQGQLAYIDLLLGHKLYMQAFTVMREVVGSIALIENARARLTSREGRDQRNKAEVFINMLQYDETRWDFKDNNLAIKQGLEPYYVKLKTIKVEAILRDFVKELLNYRNGFDHGWTKSPESSADIAEKGAFFRERLKLAVSELKMHGILL